MNKPVYLGMPMLDITKTLMYKFWYDYFKLKYGDRAKLCYTDTDSFIIHIIIEHFFEDISNDVEIFCALRAITYSYLMDDESEVKKAKGTKKCIIKWRIMFENYTDCLFNDKIILKSQQRFKSDHHKVYTEKVNKIALSSNDDKRLQTFNVKHTHTEQMRLKCVKVKC